MAEKAEKGSLGIDERIYHGCYLGAARLRVQNAERETDCKKTVRANSKYWK
jgi:hypothetical protein